MTKGIKPPKWTMIPNEMLDNLSDFSESELRILLVAMREIIGWHKSEPQPMSYSWFRKKTGLSNTGVKSGIDAAKKRGWLVEAEETGKRGVKLFTIEFDSEANDYTPENDSQENDYTSEIHSKTDDYTPKNNSEANDYTPEMQHTNKDIKKKESKQSEDILPLDEMRIAVRKYLKQYQKTQQTSIAKTLLCLHTGKDLDKNLDRPITIQELEDFCKDWDCKRTKDGSPLVRPRNQGSVLSNVNEWLKESASRQLATKQINSAYDYGVPEGYVSEFE